MSRGRRLGGIQRLRLARTRTGTGYSKFRARKCWIDTHAPVPTLIAHEVLVLREYHKGLDPKAAARAALACGKAQGWTLCDSQLEAERYRELILAGDARVHNLQHQVAFDLHVEGTRIGAYVADFVYDDEHGTRVVEDAKGYRTKEYRWKKQHVEAEYGITIREVSRRVESRTNARLTSPRKGHAMTKTTLTLAILACPLAATAADAQVSPYNPPFPGAVLIQPCGQEAGWVPADHPAAQTPTCVPTIGPDPATPWTLAPRLPMEIGKQYRDPYGLVLDIVSATVRYQRDAQSATITPRVLAVDALIYQSRWHYDMQLGAHSASVDLERARGMWWELER